MRLNRYLAKCGVSSRRKADELIRAGRVAINGRVTTELGVQVTDGEDRVSLDNRPLEPITTFRYILLNKPAGVLTSLYDPHHRATVMELVPKIPGLVPVGRLDLDTEGVLLLTNDGELSFRLTHPRYRIEKIYLAKVDRRLFPEILEGLRNGVDIGERRTVRAHRVEQLGARTLRIELQQGKKRQIKRMLQALGYRVMDLRREQFAFLRCEDLEPSAWRFLHDQEVQKLKKLVGL